MKKLKIINRSGVEIKLAELMDDSKVRGIFTIAPNCEHNYAWNRYLDYPSIRLDLPPQHRGDQPCIYLNDDFMEAYKIGYVRKGDGDHWFVDPIPRGANLVRKRVCNSTAPKFALAEFVSKKKEETWRVAGKTDCAQCTAWWEIQMPERTKNLLIVDPVDKDRKYFGRGGGPPLVGSNAELNVLREQNKNIYEIDMASHFERVEAKQNSPSGSLELRYHRGLRFWSKLSS